LGRKKGALSSPRALQRSLPASTPLSRTRELRPLEESRLWSSDLIRPAANLQQVFSAFLLDQRSEHTRRAYENDFKRFVQFLLLREAEKGPSLVDRNLLIAFKDHLLSEGLEHSTVDRHLASLRSWLGWLTDEGYFERNPAQSVRLLNSKRLSRTVGLSDEEVRKLLALPDLTTRSGILHFAILNVLLYGGLRRSELCFLRTTNLGVERGVPILKLRGKGNRERLIPLQDHVASAIRHYLRAERKNPQEDQILFTPVKNNRTGILAKALDSSSVFYVVKKYAKMAGIQQRISPHSLRATAISNARDRLVPDRAIQEFAGWANPDMITRYDKRKTSIEKSAALAIRYGVEEEIEKDLASR
jgi:site-specific recombinase XerD